jgi:hypothetical protein
MTERTAKDEEDWLLACLDMKHEFLSDGQRVGAMRRRVRDADSQLLKNFGRRSAKAAERHMRKDTSTTAA